MPKLQPLVRCLALNLAVLVLPCASIPAQDAAPAGAQPVVPAAAPKDTLWVIPHTHWEGAVFKTREEYLDMGLEHIIHALRLLEKHPNYTFVLDQVAYVKPFLERYPEHETAFRKFIAEGRLQLVLGMNSMPDTSKPGGESFIRQIQYGKGYYREKLGVDVRIAWLLDTFGHHAQLPQLLKLGGYTSFWFFRGVPRQDFPSEFMWEGLDGTQIPAFWEPHGYGDFYGAPAGLAQFEKFATSRFKSLDRNAKGHDRVAYAGVDVSDPEDQLPGVVEQAAKAGTLPMNVRLGVPTQFEAAVLQRKDLPVFKIDLNPIFQGTYSSRIELKQWMHAEERLLTTAEKLGAIAGSLGHPMDTASLWRAWDPVLFNEAHDLASGVMTDHVYDDTLRGYECSKHAAEQLIDESWSHLASSIDTRGEGTPIVVFNTLSWPRTDLVESDLGFTDAGVKSVVIRQADGIETPAQIVHAIRYRDGGIRQARVAFVARNVPALGYGVFHAVGRTTAEEAGPAGPATRAALAGATQLENEFYRVSVDPGTGAIISVATKDDNWEALSGPANVIARQDDHGDVWELYHGLDGGSRIAMTAKQPLPKPGVDKFSTDSSAKPGTFIRGRVFSQFTVSHPFDAGRFSTTIRLAAESRRIEITTSLVNKTKFVRYQAMFPTSVRNGKSVQSIPFGALERPDGIEFPAQDWVDYSDGARGVAVLNVGLPGNLATDGLMLLSLLRSHTLGGYGFGGGYEPGMTSDTGLELGQERTLHYALQPHRGDWRQAMVWREGMELANPLVCRKAAPHAGPLPPHWAFVNVSSPSVVISSVAPGRDGNILVRAYEAAGQPAPGIELTFSADLTAANEVNLMEDRLATMTPDGKVLKFNLSPFQIKTLAIQLSKHAK